MGVEGGGAALFKMTQNMFWSNYSRDHQDGGEWMI